MIGADLLNNPLGTNDPSLVADQLTRLQDDFANHNHDGTNSKQLENIVARTLQVQAAVIAGYRLFQAVVGPTAADYTSVAAALKDGNTRIFVRNGTYNNEPTWNITNAGTVIVGESVGGVVINFAEDIVNHRCIYVNAAYFQCSTIDLVSFNTSGNQDLFFFSSLGVRPRVYDVTVKCTRGSAFKALNTTVNGVFYNINFDLTTIDDSANCHSFFNMIFCTIENCFFDMQGLTTSGTAIINLMTYSTFVGCRFLSTVSNVTFLIFQSSTTVFQSCLLEMQEININANFDSCIFICNNAPVSHFITLSISSSRLNNSFITLDPTYQAIDITASSCQINNNFISGGYDIDIHNGLTSITGIQFCNNQWISNSPSIVMTGTLTAAVHNSVAVNNIFRDSSNSNVPVFTDGGTGDQFVNNVVIKG